MSADLEKLPLSMQPRSKRFNLRRLLIVILSFFVAHRVFVLLFPRSSTHHQKHIEYHADRGYGEMYKMSWQSLTQALQSAKPRTASIGQFAPVPGISVEAVDQPTSVDVIDLSPQDFDALRKSHASFMKSLKDDGKMSVIYQRGQQGIVVTATVNELPQLLVSLRLLRRTGSSLPVEVFLLSQDDYDAKICRETLPKLDAHCAILEEHLDGSTMPLMPQSRRERRIQPQEPLNKLLAVFFSRFEDVLLLDPTTLVYNNPDMMLKEEPFLSTGMLVWPDFWASTVSPKLYAIQDAPEQKPNRRDNIRTVDMGQLIISKSHHSATLLLAIYYTYFGPHLYEPLQQQSHVGELGAQAIKSAARYLEAPYFMIKRYVEAAGYPDLDSDNEGFRGVAMMQCFASDDFHRLPKDRHRPVFIRQNNPSLHPAYLIDRSVTTFRSKENPNQHAEDEEMARMIKQTKQIGAGMIKVKGGLAPAPGDPIVVGKAKSVKGSDAAFAVPKRAPTDADRGLHHRMWEWFGGRYASNGWRDPEPERALWEEVATVACVDSANFRVWPLPDAEKAQLNCERINYHRAQLGWKEFFVL